MTLSVISLQFLILLIHYLKMCLQSSWVHLNDRKYLGCYLLDLLLWLKCKKFLLNSSYLVIIGHMLLIVFFGAESRTLTGADIISDSYEASLFIRVLDLTVLTFTGFGFREIIFRSGTKNWHQQKTIILN